MIENNGKYQKKNDVERSSRIVYTYVVGDIVHIGHLRHLARSKAQGNYLIVGVLTDKATMEKKPKPIIPFRERIETIKALKCVDEVIPQETYSPLSNVEKIKPDILMENELHLEQPANAFVESYGGKVVISPYYRLQSSSQIKDKVKKFWVGIIFIDPKHYSLLKSIIWRVLGVGILATITYLFTREWIITTYITVVHHATFLLIYYLHERFWFKIRRIQGRQRIILKSLIYEVILGMGIGGLIVLIFTGEWKKVGQITITYTIIKIMTYIIFEKIWQQIQKKMLK